MDSKVQIELGFKWNVGKINLNEIVYRVDELVPGLVCGILEQLIERYQTVVVGCLSQTYVDGGCEGLGLHRRRGRLNERCHGRKVVKRGYRQGCRCIKSKYGTLRIRIQEVECLLCKARFSPLLNALGLEPYERTDEVLEKEVISAVIDTNYRRLIEGHSLDVSLGGIHNFVVGSDIDDVLSREVEMSKYSAVMIDGSGLKEKGGKKGEIRVVIGITAAGGLDPIGSWVDKSWKEIERDIRSRINTDSRQLPLLLHDGEHDLEHFLSGKVRTPQRCTWHAPRGLYGVLKRDRRHWGIREIRPYQRQLAKLVAVEIPEGDYDHLNPEAIEEVRSKYRLAKKELNDLIEILHQKNCLHAVEYLKGLLKGLYHQVDMWLATGIIAPKTTSRLERLFRELARRLKRIAWGWSDQVATKLSKMIMIKQYKPELWKRYWLKKLGINGHFQIWIQNIVIA